MTNIDLIWKISYKVAFSLKKINFRTQGRILKKFSNRCSNEQQLKKSFFSSCSGYQFLVSNNGIKWFLIKYFLIFIKCTYRISANSFRGNYSFLEVRLRPLFKGGNYSREESILLFYFLYVYNWNNDRK